MEYIIKVESFEGPFELLLDLIKKREMDIYDLQISQITNDYLGTLQNMKENQIETTSEFMELASILLEIKTRMLLPVEVEKEDPRDELVKQIINYQEYKESIEKLRELKEFEHKYFKRQKVDVVKKKKNASIQDIIQAYQSILNNNFKEKYAPLDKLAEEIAKFKYSMEEQIEYLKMELSENKLDLESMFSEMREKEQVIVTFGALLELVKIQYVNIFIESNGAIMIERKFEDHGKKTY